MSNTYHIQGAVPLWSSAYIEREFENSIFESISSGRWVLLLGPRQHGKTTGLIRIKSRLESFNFDCALVDLQSLPPLSSFIQFLDWFAMRVRSSLGYCSDAKPSDLQQNQLYSWLELSIPKSDKTVVIFIDEASAIKEDSYRNSFFGQIRSLANERAMTNSDSLCARLRFVFSGTFRPDKMVEEDLNSPFNVCEIIETKDFLRDDIKRLQQKIEGKISDEIIDTIFNNVGGHPYLIQLLLAKAFSTEDNKVESLSESISQLLNGELPHLETVFSRILGESRLIQIISKIANDGYIKNEAANYDFKFLQVLGVCKRDGSNLVFRNRLYENFVRDSPQIIKPGESKSFSSFLIAPTEDAYSFMKSKQLEEISLSMEKGAVKAYNSGSFRLALAGFGCALEALLMDWLSSLPMSTLTSAVKRAKSERTTFLSFNRNESEDKPSTWRLVNLIRVAPYVNMKIKIDPPDTLREWRNLIHPGMAINSYLSEDKLEPEARAASGLLASIRRDISVVFESA